MRRFILGVAIAVFAALTPLWAAAQTQGVAQQIANALRDSGRLKGYDINVKYQQGTAWLVGRVSSSQQLNQAIAVAEGVPGVEQVVNELTIGPAPEREERTLARSVKHLLTGFNEEAPLEEEGPSLAPQTGEELEAEEMGYEEDESAGPAARRPVVGPVVRTAQAPQTRLVNRNQAQSEPATELRTAEFNHAQPAQQTGNADMHVAQRIAHNLKHSGRMRGYRIGVNVENGQAVLSGTVTSRQQMGQAIAIAKSTQGVGRVVNRIGLQAAAQGQVRQAEYQPIPADGIPGTIPDEYAGEYEGNGGGPLPAYGVPTGMPGGYYDHPSMPQNAWPSYAAYPNYAGVTYPRQYSPTAWPYIGPFYPYPQVPLGWRRVTLEWDDGWWFLDFHDKHH